MLRDVFSIYSFDLSTWEHSWFNNFYLYRLTPCLQSFFILFRGHGDNFYKPSPDTDFFFNVYCLAQTFFFGTHVSQAENWSSAPSTVQGKCIAENQEIQFPLLCSKPGKDNHKFFLSKVCSPGANLSASCATIVEWSGTIYRPNVPIRQKKMADLSANCSQRVKIYQYACLESYTCIHFFFSSLFFSHLCFYVFSFMYFVIMIVLLHSCKK